MKKNLQFSIATLVSSLIPYLFLPTAAMALDANLTVLSAAGGDFSLELDASVHDVEHKEVENLLDTIEKQWNDHNIESLMSNYADDYINNDGLDKKAVTELTKDFWEQYPDARSSSKTKEIRIDGSYATIDSRDMAFGNTAKEISGIGGKGELRSISEGQLYLRKFANGWKIIGDRIDFEKVKVSYGLAKELDASFVAPEQVKSGKKYAAKVELKLPNGLAAVGEITSQNLQYPTPQQVFPNAPATEIWKTLDNNVLQKDSFILERIMEANTTNHNELLMTTIGVTNAAKNSLVGFEFLTRRLNVVPASIEEAIPEVAAGAQNKTKTAENKTSDGENSAQTTTDSSPQADSPRGSTAHTSASPTSKHKSRSGTKVKSTPQSVN